MRTKIIKRIEKNNSYKPVILTGPYSKSFDTFFNKELVDYYKNKNVLLITKDFPKDHLFAFIKSSLESNKHDIYLINDICGCSDCDSIINLFVTSKRAYLIATSNINLNITNTNNRGRINTIYFPPFLYEDFLESGNSSLKDYLANNSEDLSAVLYDYKYKDDALKIYKAINNQISYPISFPSLLSNSEVDVSLNTFVKIYNYLANRGFVYSVQKIDISTMEPLNNTLYIYPSFISNIIDESKTNEVVMKRVLESCVVSKLIYEQNLLYRIHAKPSENKPILNTFYVIGEKDRYLLNIFLDGNEERIKRFIEFKFYYKKYVLVLDNIDRYTDEYGVTYLNIYDFLEKGI